MIYVFKTSVRTKKAVKQLKPYLNNLLQQLNWNFDLEDCDKILRLDTSPEISASIIQLLINQGFDCKELE